MSYENVDNTNIRGGFFKSRGGSNASGAPQVQ